MFLFILESIGTSELILIGIIALIFLGPRKLPQIARTIGKTMADFRTTTNEFKSTWEREVNFEEEAQALRTGDLPSADPTTIARTEGVAGEVGTGDWDPPTIKPAQPDLFATPSVPETPDETIETGTDQASDKRNWL